MRELNRIFQRQVDRVVETQGQVNIQQKFIKPIELIYWVGILTVTLMTVWANPTSSERNQLILLLISAAIFGLVYFRWIFPRYGTKTWVHYIGATGIISAIALFSHMSGRGAHIGALYITVIACVGIVAGRKIAFRTALFAALAETILSLLTIESIPDQLYPLGIELIIIMLSGYITSQLTGIIHEKILHSERQNRYLSTLLKVGTITSQPEDLESTLLHVAEMITREVPVTTCQIFLLSNEVNQLVTRGVYPIRTLEGWQLEVGQSFSASDYPFLIEVLESGKYQVLTEEQIEALDNEQIATSFFLKGIKTACLLPMIVKGKRLGVISVGEVRHWKREPFTREKVDLLQTLTTQIAAIIENARLFQKEQRQAERLAVFNEVAKAIGSTIELEDLLELIYDQLSRVIPSDTYYVGLYDPTEDLLDIHIMIDNGKRFPRTTLPDGKGYARWIIRNRQALFIRHFSEERASLPVQPILLGQDQFSESWLGVPLLAGERILGLLAIASYLPNAFDDEDMTLLSNVAAQAALAVDNARQHAEVKEQARRDSLTGAYNHGSLLSMLNEEVERGQTNRTPVSLIMIDIDYFKEYNDHYGHVIGDQVLQLIVQSIQSHVKKTDIVGRWGGEEFAVGLPGATLEQAYEVARRIQKTLAEVDLCTKIGQSVPAPTLSQGIASFPLHAADTAQLVDIADMALYRAKSLGRNQIIIAK